jgi:hypothetical protein
MPYNRWCVRGEGGAHHAEQMARVPDEDGRWTEATPAPKEDQDGPGARQR